MIPVCLSRKRYRCRFCGRVFLAWLLAAKRPNGAMLRHHLGAMHPTMENIEMVAAEAYEVVEEDE